MKKTSIYDIAKYVGVSPATVSYAINGKKKISDETKEKINRAIKDLGYVIDNTARTLSTGKSHLIGLCLPLDVNKSSFMQNPFYVEFLSGLELGIVKYDYDIVIGVQENQEDFKNWAISRKLDGVIMIGTYPKKVYEDIKKLQIPLVLIDVYEEYAKEFHNIRVNDEKATYISTEYLINNGHKKIGFVGEISKSLVDYHRYLGYRNALKKYNIQYKNEYLYDGEATFESGLEIAEEILKRNNITAIVCSSDIIGIGIIRKYLQMNKHIPEDLSIMGFDDIQDAQYLYPSLSTMAQDIRLKGQLAAEAIINDVKNQKVNNSMTELEAKLVIRESVKKI